MKSNPKNFKFKHSHGQNFIVDEFLLEDIADESGITKDDFVLEIGPGNGALTRCLCDRAKKVVAVEIDKSLIPLLKSNLKDYENVSIINADFMELDFQTIINEFGCEPGTRRGEHCEPDIKVVANLPYYITSPIINILLQNPYISEMTLMVQKEVAERIVATPGSRDYGILTLACNYFAATEMVMVVSKDCFFPKPKVDSAVVHFKKHPADAVGADTLFKLIKASFAQRRKKLLNSLTNAGYNKDVVSHALSELGFDENVRAENLSLDDYKHLLTFFHNL
ncbi:MAG: ribosomal RNA small subunit methyltransferase A [Lachnospiraceae bacterium]|nr:ribosomal RNA small subunit methyltransferase A [Lachnospiraceae bacterium]